MDSRVFQQLQSRSAAIHVRWETLLRVEPVNGPLANPDALVQLIPQSLAQVFELLNDNEPSSLSLQDMTAERLPSCDCGQNPYRAYFVAAEQAFVEAVILIHAEMPASQRRESDVAQTIRAVRTVGGAEIDTFCGICTHRCVHPRCRHGTIAQ